MNITGENIIDLLSLIQKGALSETENQHLYIELESNILNKALDLSNGNEVKECDEYEGEMTSCDDGGKLKGEIEAYLAMCKLLNHIKFPKS